MKNYKVKLFHFDELSEDAKAKVCDKERESDYNFGYLSQETDAEERIATLDKFCEVFGIKYNIDYDHNHRFIKWHFLDVDMNGYDWCDEDIEGKYLLRFLNRYYFDILSKKYYSCNQHYDENGNFHYAHRYSRFQYERGNCPFTGMCYDCDILDKIFEWYDKPNWNISLHDLFEDVFSHYMDLWESEDDYRMSDEHISDMISANWGDKLYFEDGREFNGNEDDLEPIAA